MISVTIQSPDVELGAHWDDLVARAHPNVFMSPAALKAADATMFAKLHVLLAWDEQGQGRRLVGVWAVQERRTWLLSPVILDALPFEYAFLSSPVIDPDIAAPVMSAFVKAIADAPKLPRVILMKSLDAETASYPALVGAVKGRGGRVLTVKTENRPMIWRGADTKTTGERRKKLRQGWKRMSALGVTAIVFATEPEAVVAAVETFLHLEFKSWKGAAGTALLCRDEDATFVRRLIVDLSARGQAIVQALQIDGQTIATQIVLLSGKMAYTWKTGFDQAYAKFSPGVILVDKVTEHLFANTAISGIDSCSVENSFVAQLWPERRAMADILVDVGPRTSIGFWLEAARQLGRERLKRMRDRLRALRAAVPSRQSAPAREPAEEPSTVARQRRAVAPADEAIRIEAVSPPLVHEPAPIPSAVARSDA